MTLSSIAGVPIVILSSQAQAQSNNVLMARNGSLVYYNIMINDVAAVFSTMVVKGVSNGGLPNTAKFPTTQAELNVINAYATAHNIPLVDTGNRALAMELKTSWVETLQFTGLDYNNYVTINTIVPNYVHDGTSNTWTLNATTPTRQATLALVGMHVVGSMKGHPEMVWSTFEHSNNTPNDSFPYVDENGNTVTVPSDLSVNNWLFCNPTATGAFNISNINKSGTSINATSGHTISPSNTMRIKPFGWLGPVTKPTSVNDAEISFQETANARLIALNTDVASNLLTGDVRKMYYQVGATWNSKINANHKHVGSIALSNSTMETYSQETFSCFSCHASEIGSNRDIPRLTELSHVFGASLIP